MENENVSRSRAWILTLHEKNLENMKLKKEIYTDPENYESLANYLSLLWKKQHEDRKSAVAICESAAEKFHVHMVIYSPNPVKFDMVRKTFGNAHTEPQKGTKKQAIEYIRKVGKYAEKDEKVLYFLDFPEAEKSSRTDYLDEAKQMLDDGLTPSEIYAKDIHFFKYAMIIDKAYLNKRIEEMPIMREIKVFWHTGLAGSGKTYEYIKLLEQHGHDGVYLYNDFTNGGFDKYVENGCPEILFIDDLKPNSLPYGSLLNLLDIYKGLQTHSRYNNVVNLWSEVHITSVYSPENLYKEMFPNQSTTDSYSQLKRRITAVVWHYKKNDEYKQFVLPIHAYNGVEDIREQALLNDFNYENNKVNNDVLMASLTAKNNLDILEMFN